MTTDIIRQELSPSRLLDSPSAADWRRVTSAHHNILLEGRATSIESVLCQLAPWLPEPVSWQLGSMLALPAGECGTLVLESVAALNGQDQARLRAWLDDPRAGHRSYPPSRTHCFHWLSAACSTRRCTTV